MVTGPILLVAIWIVLYRCISWGTLQVRVAGVTAFAVLASSSLAWELVSAEWELYA